MGPKLPMKTGASQADEDPNIHGGPFRGFTWQVAVSVGTRGLLTSTGAVSAGLVPGDLEKLLQPDQVLLVLRLGRFALHLTCPH